MATKKDYYELLGVSRDVSESDLKKAYRKKAVQFHPDKNPDDSEAEEKFKEIGEAYDVLSDADKRAAYDRYGHAAFAAGGAGRGSAGGFHDPFDLFREVFGGGGGGGSGGIFNEFFGGGRGGGGRTRDGKRRGADLRYDLQISLEEAATGFEKELELEKYMACKTCEGAGGTGLESCATCGGAGQVISRSGFFQVQQSCPSCGGAGKTIRNPCKKCGGEGRVEDKTRVRIKVPAGIEEGSRLRSTGNGDAGVRGGPSGDLYVMIHLKQHDVFEREGDDLYCEMPISFTKAALGGEITVPTLEGKASIKIPPGTQSETSFRLRGKGVQRLRGGGKGDLLVQVRVEVPTKLNSEQRAKLQEFSESCGDENEPISEGFFEKAKRFFS